MSQESGGQSLIRQAGGFFGRRLGRSRRLLPYLAERGYEQYRTGLDVGRRFGVAARREIEDWQRLPSIVSEAMQEPGVDVGVSRGPVAEPVAPRGLYNPPASEPEGQLGPPPMPRPIEPELTQPGRGFRPEDQFTDEEMARAERALGGPRLSPEEEDDLVRERLGFSWGRGVRLDPGGNLVDPRAVNLPDTGARGWERAEYVPEGRGGTLSTMGHPQEGRAGADVSRMSEPQFAAHVEALQRQAAARELETLAGDPYARERALGEIERESLLNQLEARERIRGQLADEQRGAYLGEIESALAAEARQRLEALASDPSISPEEKEAEKRQILMEAQEARRHAIERAHGKERVSISGREGGP